MNLIPLFINMKLDIYGLSTLLALTRNPQRVSAGVPRGAPGNSPWWAAPMGSLHPSANQDRGGEGGIGGGQDNPDSWLAWVALGRDSCRVQSDGQALEEQPSLPLSVHTRSQVGGDGQRARPPLLCQSAWAVRSHARGIWEQRPR